MFSSRLVSATIVTAFAACAQAEPVGGTPTPLALANDAGTDGSDDTPDCGDDCPNVELVGSNPTARIAGTTWTAIGPFRGGRLDGIVVGTDPPEVGTMLVASLAEASSVAGRTASGRG